MNTDDKTNGRNRAHLDALHRAVRDCIDASYYTGARRENGSRVTVESDDPRQTLRDYARNTSMRDGWEALIREETKNESGHRNWGPDYARYHRALSKPQAALIVLLDQFGQGADLETMPSAAWLMEVRYSAGVANVLGFLCKAEIAKREGLREQLAALDYAGAVSK